MGRREFLLKLSADLKPTIGEIAIALLWYYNQTQEFEERSVSDIVHDLNDEGFGLQNVSRLRTAMRRSRYVVRGTRRDALRINAKYFNELTGHYGSLINVAAPTISSSVIPSDFFNKTRVYLEQLVQQINGCYDKGFFDACAVLIRRLVESLTIEVFAFKKILPVIKNGNDYFGLERLINEVSNNNSIAASRFLKKNMTLIKDLGDAAAHDRFYITRREDIDDNIKIIRKVLIELLQHSGIR